MCGCSSNFDGLEKLEETTFLDFDGEFDNDFDYANGRLRNALRGVVSNVKEKIKDVVRKGNSETIGRVQDVVSTTKQNVKDPETSIEPKEKTITPKEEPKETVENKENPKEGTPAKLLNNGLGMSRNTKIGLAIGGALLLGVGGFFIYRKMRK